MDGWEMKKWEVYKKEGVYKKRGSEHKYLRTKKETRRTLREFRERRVNSSNSYVNVVSLGQSVLRKWFIFIIRLAFSSLFFSLGKVPLWLFVSLSYKIIVYGHGWTKPATLLSGLGPLVLLVPTTTLHTQKYPSIRWQQGEIE